jgi:hypothetical protein
MTTTLTTTISNVLSVGDKCDKAKPRRANARLAPGGPEPARERRAGFARNLQADDAVRWQRILDLLDPGKRCGAWCPAPFEGRPVVCTRAPHDGREQHKDAETGWRWYDEESRTP